MGFTLVELLVVIGVIAVLVGLLLPVVSRARSHARSVECLTRLREIARASMLHAHDHRGHVPLAGSIKARNIVNAHGPRKLAVALGDGEMVRYSYARSVAPFSGDVPVTFFGALAPYLVPSYKPTTHDWALLERTINNNLTVSRQFFCPATDSFNSGTLASNGLFEYPNATGMLTIILPIYTWSTGTDYVLNEGLTGFDATGSLRRLGGQLSKARQASSLVLITDGLRRKSPAYGSGVGWRVWTPLDNSGASVTLAGALESPATADHPDSFDRIRHRGRINIAFADGHAESLPISAPGLREALLLPLQ